MQIKYMNTDEVIPYDRNAKVHGYNADLIANSIKQFGFKQPILIDEDNIIIAGHGRLQAAKILKLDQVPVIVADDLTEAQVTAYRIADNKVSESSTWDNDLLKLDLLDLDLDMTDFGFTQNELDDLLNDPEPVIIEESGDPVPMKDDTVIVIRCDNDAELEETFNKLTEEGYQCSLTVF